MLILKVLEIDLATTFHEIFGLCRNIKQLFIYINKCRHTYIYRYGMFTTDWLTPPCL